MGNTAKKHAAKSPRRAASPASPAIRLVAREPAVQQIALADGATVEVHGGAVAEVRDDGQLVVVTRRGKRYVLAKDDPNLRRPTLWERLRYWARFPRAG